MRKVVVLLSLPVLLGACASAGPKFVGAAESHGLTQVALGEIAYTGCGADREFARRFSAVDAGGAKVDGLVCAGLLGPTVFAGPAGGAPQRLAPGQPVRVVAGS